MHSVKVKQVWWWWGRGGQLLRIKMPDAAVTACKLRAVIFPRRLKLECDGVLRSGEGQRAPVSLELTQAQTDGKTDKLSIVHRIDSGKKQRAADWLAMSSAQRHFALKRERRGAIKRVVRRCQFYLTAVKGFTRTVTDLLPTAK